MSLERRRQRSDKPDEALELMLEACRAKSGARALVISDERGRLVASAGADRIDAERIAAAMPSPLRPTQRARLRAMSFRAGPGRVFVGVVGIADYATPMTEALRGARRILGV